MSNLRAFVAAVVASLGATAAFAQNAPTRVEARVATWNIAVLTTGKPVFEKQDWIRQPQDIAFLRAFAKARIGADIYALQEIASPAAAAQVFPLADYRICISGQFFETYPELGEPPVARCFDGGTLPDTPVTRPRAGQFTAFALRRTTVEIDSALDAPHLGVEHLEKGDARPVRWGLVMGLRVKSRPLTLVNVHLKSGCHDDPPKPPIAPGPSDDHCTTLHRQIEPLAQIVRSVRGPYVLLGDFNRRMDIQRDELWEALNAAHAARGEGRLRRTPYRVAAMCHVAFSEKYSPSPIDFILHDESIEARDPREHLLTVDDYRLAQPDVADVTARSLVERASDHCARSVRIAIP